MATILSHSIAAVAMARVYSGHEKRPAAFWITAAVCSMLPDIDVIGFGYGVHYGDLWGHRGMTHSLLAAAVIGAIAAFFLRLRYLRDEDYLTLAFLLAVVTASHGILDAMTNGGLGVAFFSPFNPRRYFLIWRPIAVSPIGIGFFSARGWHVLRSEMCWIWIPSALLFALGTF